MKTKVCFVKYAESQRSRVKPHKEVVDNESQSHFRTGKRTIQKMTSHAGSETHIRYVEVELLATKREQITHHLQSNGHEKSKS